jgi:hypothetical protein
MGKSRIRIKMLNYKFRKMKLFKNGLYLLGIFLLSITTSCNNDDDISSIIGGLDFVVATLNAEGNEVGVVASTVPGDNRIVYTVDFGDVNGEPDEVIRETSGPMVRYEYPEETATYTITVTAALSGRDDVTITKEHTVIFAVEPPPGGGDPLVGTWRLAPVAGAFGVGPVLGEQGWFANSTDDVTTRACLFDDEYIFNADGTFQNVLGADTWLEAWQGVTEECGAPVFPHDGTAEATYTYNPAGNITINGIGAFLGLAKVVNGSELGSPGAAPSEISYMANLLPDGITLELDIEIETGTGDQAFWSFKLVKDAPPVPSALDGTWRLAPEAGAFGVGPVEGEQGWFANSTDDVTTRACLFDDTYIFNTDGTFQNVLGADTWLEAWQGVTEGCGAPVFPHDGSATATYEYDASAGEITIDGQGAFLGLAKVVNGGELTNPGAAPDSVTYKSDLSSDGNTLNLSIEIETATGDQAFWSFKLVKDVVPTGIQGTWKLASEPGAFGVGPVEGEQGWFANSTDDVTTRACLFDDEYIFNADGTFQNVLGADTWLEAWQGVTEECGTPVFPHDGSASATYDYDESAGEITIDGQGAFLGLSKVVNGGELTSPGAAPSSITYKAELDGNTLNLSIEIVTGTGDQAFWSYKLARQ